MSDRIYNLIITKPAEEDLNGILDYIGLELASPQAAENIIAKIETAIEQICNFPLACPLVKDAYLRLRGYRMSVVGNYRIFYKFEEDLVAIMRVIYGKRNYENLL